MPIDTPPQIKKAFSLLWLSFAIGLTEGLLTQLLSEPSEDLDTWVWIILIVAFGLSAYFIHAASRRKNWARVVLLALTSLTIVTYLAWPEWNDQTWWSLVLFGVCASMDTVALIWLFSGEGAKWYATSELK
jgi:CDP-diglyceride synthetase